MVPLVQLGPEIYSLLTSIAPTGSSTHEPITFSVWIYLNNFKVRRMFGSWRKKPCWSQCRTGWNEPILLGENFSNLSCWKWNVPSITSMFFFAYFREPKRYLIHRIWRYHEREADRSALSRRTARFATAFRRRPNARKAHASRRLRRHRSITVSPSWNPACSASSTRSSYAVSHPRCSCVSNATDTVFPAWALTQFSLANPINLALM